MIRGLTKKETLPLKKRWDALFFFFLVLVFSMPVASGSLSGVGVIPPGQTTAEALFGAAVELLNRMSSPPTVVDRERGLIEASATRYHTMNNGPSSIEEHTESWKILIAATPDGSLRMSLDRSSTLGVNRREMIQFFRNVAVGARVGSSEVILTLDGEAKPLSEWKRADTR